MREPVVKIVAWHPVLTDHQAFTYQEVSRQSGLSVVVQVTKLEDETRRAQGWTDTRVTGVERQLIPKQGFLRHGLRLLLANRDQIHIFGSAFENPRMMLLLLAATRLRLECYIISEPYSPVPFGYFGDRRAGREQLKTWLRPWLYRGYMLALRSGLSGIFTISRLAAQQYAAAGMPVNRLFPFGYFVPSEPLLLSEAANSVVLSRRLRLVFVGSLIARKGLSTLIGAVRLSIASGADLQLDVYGPGDPTGFDFDGEKVRYRGRIPFGETQQRLPGYDLLVLPSNYDGWGVVVNEALCAGVPVLCSDQVGARVLVETFGAGLVFARGDEKALADLLMRLATRPETLHAMKSVCAAAAQAIQPVRAAAYMLAVLSAEPTARAAIVSPWYRAACSMPSKISRRYPVRLHLTNVTGAGATQLLESLLPALEEVKDVRIDRIELPDRGKLAQLHSSNPDTVTAVYRRHLPNALSRFFECTWLAGRFNGESPLLVLGDLPLRCRAPQTVFLQQSNLLKPLRYNLRPNRLKYALGRVIFKLNLNRVRAFIVQTDVMRDALERSYPKVVGKVHVIAQPVPAWLLHSGVRRQARDRTPGQQLELIYPAADYPHKNHKLLSRLDPQTNWPVKRLILTLDPINNPAPKMSWVECCGFLSSQRMIEEYSRVDALLFLSKEESYGFPLVEAMFVGLPIVCPDLAYARTLCGEQAIYFQPDCPNSLLDALNILQNKLKTGWWPDWTRKLEKIPNDWDFVAKKMLAIACT
jgi:glycosyltransferase involved in cell wall biosynthesis